MKGTSSKLRVLAAAAVALVVTGAFVAPAIADQVINDDLIVQGSECLGFDCVDGETFGFDTLRLKENNLRIKLEDTSTASGFASTDWQLTANESGSGGLNKFSIDDVTGATVPFTIEGGAPSHSLYTDSSGRLGLGTSSPVVQAHMVDGNTPDLRLEQDGSSGFSPQTWDVAGNEANFFVRDVTSGSRLPFRIRPGAPTSSIDISGSGDVGVGTASPESSLHVHGSDGNTELRVEETSTSVAKRFMLRLENNGAPGFIFRNDDANESWEFAMDTLDRFVVSRSGTGGAEFLVDTDGEVFMGRPFDFRKDANGNVIIDGTLTENSDRSVKQDVEAVDVQEVLAKLTGLPISTWAYIHTPDSTHMGPMAQEFYAAFGLGRDPTKVSPRDMAAVTMAAVQALDEERRAMREEIAELKSALAERDERVDDLEARLRRIEERLE